MITPLSASIFHDLFGDSLLNTVYALALFIGLLYAVFLVFFHGIGDALGHVGMDLHIDTGHFDLGHVGHAFDHGIDHGDSASDATHISVLAIASFISSFGAFGLGSVTLLGAGSVVSFILALLGGIGFGIAAQVFFMYILSPTVSSEILQAALIGQVAEIITPIPVNGVGQIAFVAQGSRVTYSARASEDAAGVERGIPVRIERIVGGTAYVSPIDS
jgi:hypothetical protein